MNIEQLKAARDAISACIEMSDNTSVPENERVVWSQGTTAKPFIHIGMLKMILPLLDQAINAPKKASSLPENLSSDLESLKREVVKECGLLAYEIDGAVKAIDHLAPRIVREGMVVVPVEVIKEINRLSKMNTSREYKESENYNYDEEDIGATFIDAYDMFVRDVRLLNKKLIAASKGD